MAETVASLLRRSLLHLAGEVPDSYQRLVGTMGSLVVEVRVGDECFTVIGSQQLDVHDGTAGHAQVHIATWRETILDVIDARLGLDEAIETDRVAAKGSLDDLVRAHDTLMAFVHAAVRAPSLPGLLNELYAPSRDGPS